MTNPDFWHKVQENNGFSGHHRQLIQLMSTRTSAQFLILFIGLLLPSCVVFTEREYEEFTKDLDGRNELCVSTYPAGAPRDKLRIPYVFRWAESADKVYFQVNIRDMKKKFGHNPNIRSIHINSLSYRVAGGPKKELISGFPNNYWMQGNKIDAPGSPPPVPYVRGEEVAFEADFKLNGKNHKVSGTMPADGSTWIGPLVFYGTGN